MNKKYFVTLDTETVGLKPVNYVYDIAWCIHDKNGHIVASYNYLIRDVVTDADKMMGAFFAKKIFSHYIPALDAGKIKMISWQEFGDIFRTSLATFAVDVIAAYNARFDLGAIRTTQKLYGSGNILTQPYDLLCIWDFACRTILNRPTYKKLATTEGWVSEAKNFRTNAETTYRYISGNREFIESHTALDDAKIETEILAYCFRQKKSIPYNKLTLMPWKIPNTA